MYLQVQDENVFWSRGLSLVYPGTKCLGKCPAEQIGAGTLSSGNPANQNNPHGLATTLWSKREGLSPNFKSMAPCRCTVFYFFKRYVSPLYPNFTPFYFILQHNPLVLESKSFTCTWVWFEYVGRYVCFLSDQQLWLNCQACAVTVTLWWREGWGKWKGRMYFMDMRMCWEIKADVQSMCKKMYF